MTETATDEEIAARRNSYLTAVLAMVSNFELSEVLDRIVKAAADLLDARYTALGVLDDAGTALSDFRTFGLTAEQKAAIGNLPSGHGILGLVITNPLPMRLDDLGRHPDSYGFPPNHPPMTAFLGVPITLHNRVFGNLYLTDKRTGEPFDEADEEVCVALAAAAAVAIENARLHARLEAMAVVEDRERIARDLHDTVIQRLFAVGMSLQATAQRADDAVRDRVDDAVNELDAIIKDVRSAIFRLEAPKAKAGLVPTTRAIVAEVTRVAGFSIRVDIQSDLDSLGLTSPIRHSFVACLREGLSNAARHADAKNVELDVGVVDGWLTLTIRDDGPNELGNDASDGNGLTNVKDRAEELGGSFQLRKDSDGRTRFEWKVPITSG